MFTKTPASNIWAAVGEVVPPFVAPRLIGEEGLFIVYLPVPIRSPLFVPVVDPPSVKPNPALSIVVAPVKSPPSVT